MSLELFNFICNSFFLLSSGSSNVWLLCRWTPNLYPIVLTSLQTLLSPFRLSSRSCFGHALICSISPHKPNLESFSPHSLANQSSTSLWIQLLKHHFFYILENAHVSWKPPGLVATICLLASPFWNLHFLNWHSTLIHDPASTDFPDFFPINFLWSSQI